MPGENKPLAQRVAEKIPFIGTLFKKAAELFGQEKEEDGPAAQQDDSSKIPDKGKGSKPYIVKVETTIVRHDEKDKDKGLLSTAANNVKNITQGIIGLIPIIGPLINMGVNKILEADDKGKKASGKDNDRNKGSEKGQNNLQESHIQEAKKIGSEELSGKVSGGKEADAIRGIIKNAGMV
jgi:hypothetical protein